MMSTVRLLTWEQVWAETPSVAQDLQHLVDSLARRLGRAVMADDPRFHLLAHSAHQEEMDEVRRHAIMARQAAPAVVQYLEQCGVGRATEPFWIPARDDLGMKERLCVPIRYENRRLGYFWLIDPERTIDGETVAVLREAAGQAAETLLRTQLMDELRSGRERELVRDLLLDDAEVRAAAASEIIESGFCKIRGKVAVLVARFASDGERPPRSGIERALQVIRSELAPGQCLHLSAIDHGMLLVSMEEPAVRRFGMHGLGLRVREALQTAGAAVAAEVVVGIGGPASDLSDPRPSHRRAEQMARLILAVPGLGPVLDWTAAGFYRLLTQLPVDEVLDQEVVHPGLRRLLAQPSSTHLVETLRVFLERAGDIKGSAAELCIHRATLYDRLERIQDITGSDLRQGEDRLLLHLGLKLATVNRYQSAD